MSNRLEDQKSPYLLQHADNPVNWYPWSEEAFEKAREEDKPVFLSIGYATCHWCHVMAHESFEDEDVAELLNETFVNIKVDREERPDIDNTYMTVCQMLTGSGGWPLTIFMTPDKKPFYAATYIPKRGRYGRPGMMELIPRIKELWDTEREKVHNSSEEILDAFQKSGELEPGNALEESVLDKAFKQFSGNYDKAKGGFGNAPKFPSPHNLMFLLRYWNRSGDESALAMVTHTLREMRLGGIYDQVGFGFHRYSTDARWLVPHFEKMLYDQAMLMLAYTEAWQATSIPLFKQTVEEIATYLFRDMRDDSGAYYSAEDADSEGEEGKYYVWSVDEIRKTLDDEEAELFVDLFNFSEEGNFEEEASGERTGKNIPHLKEPVSKLAGKTDRSEEELQQTIEIMRKKLFSKREERVRPLLDDKILTDWNGLIIAALAKAGNVLDKSGYVDKAREAADFILDHMRTESGLLKHRFRDGDVAIEAHLDDYSFLIWGLLELYQASFEIEYLEEASALNGKLIENFWDSDKGGFYFTSEESEKLLGRKKEGYDGALPSGNSVAALNLLKLGRITADNELEEKSEEILRLFSEQINRAPTGFGQMLQAADFGFGPAYEIVIAGQKDDAGTHSLATTVSSVYLPNKVVIVNDPRDGRIRELAPFTSQQEMIDGEATAYVCRNYRCEKPVNDPDELLNKLQQSGND